MAVNLHSRYDKKIAEIFTRESLIDGHINDKYEFTGVKTVKITTPVTVPLNDYQRNGSNRYGNPVEMQDTLQEMIMSQDKSFALTIDKGNNSDQQNIKAAGLMMGLQVKERVAPERDRYSFMRLATLGGNIVGDATTLTRTNVVERIAKGTKLLNNLEVPADGRTLFVTAETHMLLRLSDEFIKIPALGKTSLAKGEVGQFDNMPVIMVPDSRFPANVNFLILHKSSATAPRKIDDTNYHENPPGLSGHLLEGRFYYDCFVIGARADGIYVEVNTGSGAGTVLAVPTINATTGAITVASGAQAKYTVDGTDPRYSTTAVVGTAPTVSSGVVVKAYAYNGTAFPSGVATATIA